MDSDLIACYDGNRHFFATGIKPGLFLARAAAQKLGFRIPTSAASKRISFLSLSPLSPLNYFSSIISYRTRAIKMRLIIREDPDAASAYIAKYIIGMPLQPRSPISPQLKLQKTGSKLLPQRLNTPLYWVCQRVPLLSKSTRSSLKNTRRAKYPLKMSLHSTWYFPSPRLRHIIASIIFPPNLIRFYPNSPG